MLSFNFLSRAIIFNWDNKFSMIYNSIYTVVHISMNNYLTNMPKWGRNMVSSPTFDNVGEITPSLFSSKSLNAQQEYLPDHM